MEPWGFTLDELQRALQVPKEEISKYLEGVTVTRDSRGETVFPFEDCQRARMHFIYHKPMKMNFD